MEGPHLCWQKMSKKPLTFPRKLWNVLSQKPLNSQLNFSPVKKIDIVYVKIVISILSFFSFLNFFCLNILLGFLGFIFKVHKLSSKFDFFFRCCSILDLISRYFSLMLACILDYIAVGSVHIHFDTSFYYMKKIFGNTYFLSIYRIIIGCLLSSTFHSFAFFNYQV